MKTLLLDNTAWDLVLDASGNIAVATAPYAIAQNVATALRTFKDDCFYARQKGLPYYESILGKWPPESLLKEYLQKEALTQENVTQAVAGNLNLKDRNLTGDVLVTDNSNNKLKVKF